MTIKELRARSKLSQADFARSLGIGVSTVSNCESGRSQPGRKVIDAIREVYGVQITAAPEEAAPAGKAPKASGKEPPRKEAAPKKTARKGGKKAVGPQIIIQSPLGGEITPFAILAKVGDVDRVYIRVDMNKAYWVKGSETGSVDLW